MEADDGELPVPVGKFSGIPDSNSIPTMIGSTLTSTSPTEAEVKLFSLFAGVVPPAFVVVVLLVEVEDDVLPLVIG